MLIGGRKPCTRYLSYADLLSLAKASVIDFKDKSAPAILIFSDKVSSVSSSAPVSLTVAIPSEILVSDVPKGSFETYNTLEPFSAAA